MLEFIKYYQSLSQLKRQKNKSFDLLVQSHTDRLMFAEMDFCHDISNLFSELLTKFQTHNPVMPFPFWSAGKYFRKVY